MIILYFYLFFFFFNDTATTEIYTLSLHDALPISQPLGREHLDDDRVRHECPVLGQLRHDRRDRKSTRLNSSHSQISYAVFCLKKKKKHNVMTSLEYLHSQNVFILISHILSH